MNPSILWLIALIALSVFEAVTVGLVSIWFAVGALFGLFASFFTDSILVQVIVFIVVSLISLVAMRPLVQRYMVPRQTPTNADRVIGQEGVVTLAIENLEAQGQVKVQGAIWTARSTTGTPIPEGTIVRIERIEGVKLMVTPL